MPSEHSNGGASPDESPPEKQLQDLEEELCRLGGVLAVRVVGDKNGRPVEVHVLSDHTKPAKQTVRDVRAVAQTVFGRGVSFMERTIKWHYMPMNDDEYRQALDQVSH